MQRNESKKIAYIYIAGYGRSGSTLLDIMLHGCTRFESVGALANFPKWMAEDQICACGNSVKTCGFWSKVTSKSQAMEKKLSFNRFEKFSGLSGVFFPKVKKEDYLEANRLLIESINQISQRSGVVDSSKTTRDCFWRLHNLRQINRLDTYLIFLARDPRGVVFSSYKSHGSPERQRFSSPLIRAFIALAFWNLTNFVTFIYFLYFDRPKTFLRYENFVDQPLQSFKKIQDDLSLDIGVENLLEGLEGGFKPGHNLGGNRLRFSTKAIKIEANNEWESQMPMIVQGLILVLCSPVCALLKIISK